ncbi:MAG: hypothetical protein LBF60_11115 [Treponema sp.]|nr:hypothetical protein [Treponema sp.]
MDKTRTPLAKRFTAMYLAAEDKGGLSAKSLKKKMGALYLTAWTMLRKTRAAMDDRDGKHTLEGVVEMDESFSAAPLKAASAGAALKRPLCWRPYPSPNGASPRSRGWKLSTPLTDRQSRLSPRTA